MRLAILEGDLAPEDLVKLSPNELATEEVKDARDAESKASTLERRADYYQIARAGIQVRRQEQRQQQDHTLREFHSLYCNIIITVLFIFD